MADTEDYFPRGGIKPTTQFYKQSSNFLGAVEKGEKKKKKPRKKTEGDDGYLSDEFNAEFDKSSSNCAHGISYQTLREGLLILGRVRVAFDTKVHISLPCHMTGAVMACHVSDPYNKLLEAYVNDQVDKVKELPRMFRPGQYVAVRVLEVEKDHPMLSMMPQHVNSMKQHTDIFKGTLFQAAVSSVEDHGYLMDLGITNTRAFLPKAKCNEEVELDVGDITWCVARSVAASPEGSVVTLSNQLAVLQDAVVKREPPGGVACLLPGTAVDFFVDKALSNGIEGHIFHTTTAYVQRQHADAGKVKKPSLGQRVRARLLYQMPTRKTPFLTLNTMFETTYPDLDTEQEYKDGHIIDNAKVIRIVGRSILFRLGNSCIGHMSLKNLQVDEDLTDEDVVAKSYPLGSEHRVRVLRYHLCDRRYAVSDSASVLGERYFTAGDLQPGAAVQGRVTAVNDQHVRLQVGRLSGLVPQTHLSDAGVYVDPKKASVPKLSKKKFKVGQEVEARVLAVNPDNGNLLLTMKPSLLSPDLDVLRSYEEACVGKSYTGFIRVVKDDYILVSFFNHVTSYIPKRFVSKEQNLNMQQAFHIGQIVNCTILQVNPNAKKMSGSFTTAPFDPTIKRNKPVKRTQDQADILNAKETENCENEVPSSKKKKRTESVSSDFSDKKKKKSKKGKEKVLNVNNSKVVNSSEESDVIETDINEDTDSAEPILTPQDQNLINMESCVTYKDFRKRVSCLKKSIAKRIQRLKVVKKKIDRIPINGLDTSNRKFYRVMQTEMRVIEERLDALTRAIDLARKRIEEFPEHKYNIEKIENKAKVEQTSDVKVKENKKHKKVDETKKDTIANNVKSEEKVVKSEDKVKIKAKDIKVAEGLTPVLELPSAKDFWSTNSEMLSKNVQELKADEESSSSEDEVQEQPRKKRKKLSATEKVSRAREEEARLRTLEARAAGGGAPASVEQFQRSLLAEPDRSDLWVAYMAFHLQATEVEKARAVARKALNTISFREEQEKLNVWLAMLNFENRFGTKETQQKVLEEALHMNDTFKVHSSLLDIYVETSKQQELTSLVDLMMRKYRRDPAAYTLCGAACYRLGALDKARYVMQKAISVLDKKEHVSALVQFALMERSMGCRDRAEALFEQVLGAYPQRVDVVSTYVDMLYKSQDVDHIRQVMERMTSQKLPARKMKVLYKKWIEVEEKIGDEEQIDRIRQKATEFIEKAQF